MFKAFLIALVLVIIGGSFFSWSRNRASPPTATTTPQDEVARVEPPADRNATITLALNQAGTRQGVTITPVELVSDSRCPKDVECVWAGNVEVRAKIASATGTSMSVFEIGTEVTTEAEIVRLVSVAPYPTAGQVSAPSDYRFTFEVRKR